MNNPRRKAIDEIYAKLESLKTDLEDLMAEEEEYRDNMPENLQGGERYEKAEEACDNLQSAIDSMDEVLEYLSEATN